MAVIVSIVSTLWAGRFGVRILTWVRHVPVLISSKLAANRTQSVRWTPELFPGVKSAGSNNSALRLNLVTRLTMSGGIPLLLLYAFMLWTGTTLPFTGFNSYVFEFYLIF